jgi:hypothetical protein
VKTVVGLSSLRIRNARMISRACVGGAVIALLIATGCSSPGGGLQRIAETSDPAGDVEDAYEHTPVQAPDFVDALNLAADLEDGQLVLTLDLAGDVPKELDPDHSTLLIGLMLDMEGEPQPDYVLKIRSEDAWQATLWCLGPDSVSAIPLPGSVEIAGRRVVVRVDRTAIGNPDGFRLNAATVFDDYPTPDPLAGVSAKDAIPNSPDDAIEVALGGGSGSGNLATPCATASPAPIAGLMPWVQRRPS